ncbi:hypothetical protein ACFV23_05070 [Streptomyces sp. NPDC059627]
MSQVMGDTDYGPVGTAYSRARRTDPRIAALVHEALGDARTIVNVGAGAGSYEPLDRHVLPVEPSAAMRAQRPAHLAPAIDGVAEHLPFDDDSIDCVDGFTEAYYARPESFLDPAVRRAQSAWTFLEPGGEERAVERLAADLASGAWDERYGHLRTQPEFHGAARLIVSP